MEMKQYWVCRWNLSTRHNKCQKETSRAGCPSEDARSKGDLMLGLDKISKPMVNIITQRRAKST